MSSALKLGFEPVSSDGVDLFFYFINLFFYFLLIFFLFLFFLGGGGGGAHNVLRNAQETPYLQPLSLFVSLCFLNIF